HVLQGRIELDVLRRQLLLALLQRPALALALLGRYMALAKVANGVRLDGVEPRSQRLSGYFDGYRTARRRLQHRLPALHRPHGMQVRRTLEKLGNDALADQLVPGASAELGGPRIDIDDAALSRDDKRLAVSGNVEGFPNGVQKLATSGRTSADCHQA